MYCSYYPMSYVILRVFNLEKLRVQQFLDTSTLPPFCNVRFRQSFSFSTFLTHPLENQSKFSYAITKGPENLEDE